MNTSLTNDEKQEPQVFKLGWKPEKSLVSVSLMNVTVKSKESKRVKKTKNW